MPDTSLWFKDLDRYIAGARPQFESLLGQLVETPTVSADPAYLPSIKAGASLAKQAIEGMGGTADIVETPGNPVIVGKMGSHAGAKTLTIYNHMDVQPAQEPEWTAEPFKFVIDGDRYLGRGSTDDKGPALSALFAARYAQEAGIPLNIQFIWELEEEIGSPNFAHFLGARGEGLRTDSVLISDTVWLSRQVPAMPYGLRGLQAVTLSLETATRSHRTLFSIDGWEPHGLSKYQQSVAAR